MNHLCNGITKENTKLAPTEQETYIQLQVERPTDTHLMASFPG